MASNDDAFEQWIIDTVSKHEGVYGVRMTVQQPAEFTVTCNLHRTTQENAMACYRALKGGLGENVEEWKCTVDISMFRGYGASNDR